MSEALVQKLLQFMRRMPPKINKKNEICFKFNGTKHAGQSHEIFVQVKLLRDLEVIQTDMVQFLT